MIPIVHGLVLAAGRSERSGTIKALAPIEGEPLVARAIRVLRTGGCGQVWVVVGPPFGERVAAAADGAQIVRNPSPERGMLSSLAAGLRAIVDAGSARAVIFALVDHPRVRPEVVARLIEHFDATGADVVRPLYREKPGHPVLIAARAAERLNGADLDKTVRNALAEFARVEDVAVDDSAILDDADTPDALRALGGNFPTR